MDKKRKEQLESKGWKIGTASDFLNLTPEENEYIEMKIRLSHYLKAFRKEQKLTQTQLANLIHSSQSRVVKMEHGDPSVSLDLLIRSLLAMGKTKHDLAEAILSESSAS